MESFKVKIELIKINLLTLVEEKQVGPLDRLAEQILTLELNSRNKRLTTSNIFTFLRIFCKSKYYELFTY